MLLHLFHKLELLQPITKNLWSSGIYQEEKITNKLESWIVIDHYLRRLVGKVIKLLGDQILKLMKE